MSEQGDKSLKATSFRIPADRLKALRILAIERGLSMGKAVEQAVENWMKENGQPPCGKGQAE